MSNLDEGEGDEGENDTSQYADDVQNLLLQGAENQCTDDVEWAIESGVDINCVNTMEESALIITVKQNSICSEERNCADNTILDMLLSSGANVNVEDIHANSPIILAMDKGCVHQVKKLIQVGADVNAKIIGTSVLYCAVHKDNIDIVEILLKEGADINSTTIEGCTPLMRAVRNENIICIHMLLKGGVKVGQFDAQGFNTFDFLKRPNENICNILYSTGEDCMTDGGHSRIVSVENPKLDILNIEYSEPGLLLYICRDQIRQHVLDVNRNLNLFCTIPHLPIPSRLCNLLLFDVTLDL